MPAYAFKQNVLDKRYQKRQNDDRPDVYVRLY